MAINSSLSCATTLALAALACAAIASSAASAFDQWPHWRGPLGTGESPTARPPLEWSETKNIRWKIPLPGKGHSSPIVWDNRVFVTTAIPVGEALEPVYNNAPGAHDNLPVTHYHQFDVLAIDRSDGRISWRRTVIKELPHEAGHYTGSLASNSPVTDGERLYAFFGSRGLYCFTVDGEPLWEKQFGRMHTKHAHGEGSSPVLHDGLLIVNWDHENGSFIAAFEARTGKEKWKVPRDEMTSWSSPIIALHAGKPQVVVSATSRIRGYDLETGKVIWECGGMSANVVASPVAGHDMVFAGSSYEKQAFVAIRLDGARGDITGTDRVAWARGRSTPYVPSPLLYGDWLYFLRHYQGVLSRVRARDGHEPAGPFRLNAVHNMFASPVAAAGRIYITEREGSTLVLSHADTPEPLAVNPLDDSFSATAALAGADLFLRGERFLYRICASAR